MATATSHTDWETSLEHSKQISSVWSFNVRKPEVRKKIPGITQRRITKGIRQGIWIKPLGSVMGRTFSSVRDVGRRSLVVIVIPSSTTQSADTTEYEKIRDKIRELFHNRRGTDLAGELYSGVKVVDYDVDDVASRDYDVDLIEIITWFREDREYAS